MTGNIKFQFTLREDCLGLLVRKRDNFQSIITQKITMKKYNKAVYLQALCFLHQEDQLEAIRPATQRHDNKTQLSSGETVNIRSWKGVETKSRLEN